jgi:hypothetical protein
MAQQVSITDLDLPQLADVRRQLEEVNIWKLWAREEPSDRLAELRN